MEVNDTIGGGWVQALQRQYERLDDWVGRAVRRELAGVKARRLRFALLFFCASGLLMAVWRPQSAPVCLVFPLLLTSFFEGPLAGVLYSPLALAVWAFSQPGLEGIDLGLFLALCMFSIQISGVTAGKYRELFAHRRIILDRLELAREVQRGMEPPAHMQVGGLLMHTSMEVCDALGGDFVAARELPDGGALIVLGDVQGKGPQSALTAACVVGAFDQCCRQGIERPEEILRRLHELLDGPRGGRFVTALCLRCEPCRRRWEIANAGHPRPIVFGPTRVAMFGGSGLVLGLDELFEVAQAQVQLVEGERLLLMSDGCYEEEDVVPGLAEVLREPGVEMREIQRWFARNPVQQVDDRTLVLLECGMAVRFGEVR